MALHFPSADLEAITDLNSIACSVCHRRWPCHGRSPPAAPMQDVPAAAMEVIIESMHSVEVQQGTDIIKQVRPRQGQGWSGAMLVHVCVGGTHAGLFGRVGLQRFTHTVCTLDAA